MNLFSENIKLFADDTNLFICKVKVEFIYNTMYAVTMYMYTLVT